MPEVTNDPQYAQQTGARLVNQNKKYSEKTGPQILTQSLAGGILYPTYDDEFTESYANIWGGYADIPCCPDLDNPAPANDAFSWGTQWQFFYTRRAIWYRAIRRMRRHPTINLARILSIAPALAAGWSYEETKNAPVGAKEWFEKEIEPFRLHLIQTGLAGCIDFGWQSYEKVFEYLDEKYLDGKVHIKKLKPLLPDLTHIRVNPINGEFTGLQQFMNFASIQQNSIINLDLEESLLYYIDYEGNNLYGNSVMRVAEMPYRFSQVTNSANLRYDKKIAGSHWVVSYPIGTSLKGPKGAQIEVDNFEIAQAIIQTLESSGAVAIPTMLASYIDDLNSVGGQFASEKRDWRVEILSDNSAGAGSFDTRLRYLDTLIFRAFGLPERSASEGQFGTKAEAGEHIDFALTHITFRHDWFCQLTNYHLVNQLMRINWGRRYENTVYIKPKPLNDESIAFLRQAYLAFLQLPSTEPQEVTGTDFEALRQRIGIPVNKEEEEDLDANQLTGPADEKLNLQDLISSINQQYTPAMPDLSSIFQRSNTVQRNGEAVS